MTIAIAFLILPVGHILPVQSQGTNPDISITCLPTTMEYGVLTSNNTSEYSNTIIAYCDLSNPTSYNESVNIQITAAGLDYRAPDSVFVGPNSTVTFELEIYGHISDDAGSRQITVSARVDQANGQPCPTCTSQTTSMLVVASEIQTDETSKKLVIALNSWQANTEEIWDQDESPPDPQFRICAADVLSNWDDCVNSPTWTDSWNISSGWNVSFEIPAGIHLINLTIECEDDDALNDDECDMNSQTNEWKQYFVYSEALGNETTFWGDGLADGDSSNRDAMSNWTIFVDYDPDRDGVYGDEDACPDTPDEYKTQTEMDGCHVSEYDIDEDGVAGDLVSPLGYDQCVGTSDSVTRSNYSGFGEVDVFGCWYGDYDSDSDGVRLYLDQCPDTPESGIDYVDQYGCYNQILDDEFPTSDLSDGETDSFPTDAEDDSDLFGGIISLICCIIGILGIIGLVSAVKKKDSGQVFVQQVPVNHVAQQQQMQTSVDQLDQQRRQAQYEAEQLRKQLTDSASYTAAQMQTMQAEMARLQETVSQAEKEKIEMQDELDKAKSTTVVQNITYNIQDSAIAGDINATGLKEKDD